MSKITVAGFDYAESCEIAKKCGVVPIEKPDENLIKVLDTVSTMCLSKVSFDHDDMDLAGIYLYRAADQKDLYVKMSFGLTSPDKNNKSCIIGLAEELFERGTPEFYRIVFLHELAHRCGAMSHDEDFQVRLNAVMQDFYTSDRYRYNTDAAGNVTGRKVWAM